jgi:succinyl-diaminopimelate desuccinylase
MTGTDLPQRPTEKDDAMDVIAMTQRLVRFDTRNPPGNEQACADFLADRLEAAGFQVTPFPLAEGRPNLIVRGPGVCRRPPLCLSGHLDTVPLGERAWRHDPLAGTIAGDRLYGRGASDMKAGVAAMVAAACAVGPDPAFCLVLTAGEENGCEGARFLAEQGVLPQTLGALVVGEPTANDPLLGHKGVLWLEAAFTGRTAHGSAPELGDNAVVKAARFIAALQEIDFAAEPHPVLGAPTFNVGTIRGGMNINSVPDRAVVGLDIRTVPGMSHTAVTAAVRHCAEERVEITPLADMASVATEVSDPWMEAVFEAVAARTGRRPVPRGAAYFTDAAVLCAATGHPPTVLLGPGEPSQAHQTDEYVCLPRIAEAVAIYTDLLRAWCRV